MRAAFLEPTRNPAYHLVERSLTDLRGGTCRLAGYRGVDGADEARRVEDQIYLPVELARNFTLNQAGAKAPDATANARSARRSPARSGAVAAGPRVYAAAELRSRS